jgi:uncharacterized protein (TIGR03086 family)
MADEDRTHTVSKLIEAGRDREAAQHGALVDDEGITTHPLDHGATMDPLTQFAQLAEPLGTVMAGITPDQLDRPTPCAEFTVRGVLEHMIGGATMFTAAYRGETPPEPDLGDVLADIGPALAALGDAISAPGALDRTVAAPFGRVPGETFARYVVLDGLVHGWDLATATDQAYDPPDELVAAAHTYARQTLDPLRDGDTFADAVDAPLNASPIQRLAAYTGRRP